MCLSISLLSHVSHSLGHFVDSPSLVSLLPPFFCLQLSPSDSHLRPSALSLTHVLPLLSPHFSSTLEVRKRE